MNQRYKVRLADREGVEYRDENDVYRFGVTLVDKIWRVYLPGSKGEYYKVHELSEEERNAILPRIKQYLEGRKYFGLFGSTYPVVFEPEPQVTAEMQAARLRASEHLKQLEKSRQR